MIPRECQQLAEADLPISCLEARGEGEVYPTRTYFNASPVVGKETAGRVSVDAAYVALTRSVR